MNGKFSEKEFKDIFSKVRRICADLIIKNSRGEILLTLRKHNPVGFWHLPGGMIYYNESVENAVHRLAKEELNAEVKIIKHSGFIDWFDYIGGDKPISIVFEVKLVSPENKIKLDFQASEWKFFSEIPENILKEQKQFLDKLNWN
ncbi:NUDIX hydrolase [Candidatus Pacearchaeota archaeon]|nr:NUDIX hydrolase [Candidatus Pacearchaeota archaeon]